MQKTIPLLHNHTDASIRDSAMSVKSLVSRAKEFGITAVALTDHGVLVNIPSFMKECQKQDIKGIPGVEAYFFDDRDNDDGSRAHMILMAKNNQGYTAICKAVSESYEYSDKKVPPRMDYQILRKYFGENTIGHDNIICTSACANGIIAQLINGDELLEREIEKQRNKLEKCEPPDAGLPDMLKQIEIQKEHLVSLSAQSKELTKIINSSVKGLERKLAASTTPEREVIQKQYDEIINKKAEAETELTEVKSLISKLKQSTTLLTKHYDKQYKLKEKWKLENDKLTAILKRAKTDEERYELAKGRALMFKEIFGDNFFLELQYHGLEKERKCMPLIKSIADECGIPLIIANDAHYATNSPDDIRAWEIVKALRFTTLITEDKEEGHGELYIKTPKELATSLTELFDIEVIREAYRNTVKVADMCNVEFAHGQHYPVFKGGRENETSIQRLKRLCVEGVYKRYPGLEGYTDEHKERIRYELEVIEKQGFADYLCIVQEFVEKGRELEKESKNGFAYYVDPGRGSAVGSLVCYLTGITSVDPLEYGLLFERFLNPERVSQPDIDVDFHTGIRELIIEFARIKYGRKAVCNIITRGTMAARKAIRNVAKVTGIPLVVVDLILRILPKDQQVSLSLSRSEDKQAKQALDKLCKENAVAAQLVKDAMLVEGVLDSYGMHAGGVLISDNEDITDYIPLMYNHRQGAWVSQIDMNEAEYTGLLKMDLLGLKNIDIIDDSLQRNYESYGIKVDIESVQFKSSVFDNIFASAKTNSVFQFESRGIKEMLKKLQPANINDVILLNAAFRPGPMQYLEDIIKVKAGKKKPEYIVPELEEILSVTYGYPVYQEQVMQIFNKVAGFSLGESDIVRRAMSKKKVDILTDTKTNYKGRFNDGLVDKGATAEQAEKFWTELLEFAQYCFNKSHAVAYSLLAFYTAYLKQEFLPEFMCSVMSRMDKSKTAMLINECRSLGLEIKTPDINKSDTGYKNTGNVITIGFGDVLNVASAGALIVEERTVNGKFSSILDFIERAVTINIDITAIKSLIMAGAFDAFCDNRAVILDKMPNILDMARKNHKKKKELEELSIEMDVATTIKEEQRIAKLVMNRETSIAAINTQLSSITFAGIYERTEDKLKNEREALGCYISGHPLDSYDESIRLSKSAPIADVEEDAVRVCGIVSELVIRQRKTDGAEMAFFKLSDKSGEIEIKCWSGEYARFKDMITDDAILTIEGRAQIDTEIDEEGEEVLGESFIAVTKITSLKKIAKQLFLVSVPAMKDYERIIEELAAYKDNAGCAVLLYDEEKDELSAVDTYRLSEGALVHECVSVMDD
jgi:DNA polymerase-3 subunit alpha